MSVFIIAEAGVNHNGSIELAFKLIDAAVEAGVDAVKFQTFKAENLVSKNTQKDLINYYNIPENKTSVIYHGADHLNKKKLHYIINYFQNHLFFLWVQDQSIKILKLFPSHFLCQKR